MLTKNERKWLKDREEKRRKFSWNDCYREYTSACKFCRDKCKYVITSCPLHTNWQDAAEFESRVAVVAANGAQIIDDPFMLLKYSRLYVEEEMEE